MNKTLKIIGISLGLFLILTAIGLAATAIFAPQPIRPAALESYNDNVFQFQLARRGLCNSQHLLRLATLTDYERDMIELPHEEVERLQNLIANPTCDFQ